MELMPQKGNTRDNTFFSELPSVPLVFISVDNEAFSRVNRMINIDMIPDEKILKRNIEFFGYV